MNLHEYFSTKRIRLYIQILNTQHFIDKAVKFARAFLDFIEMC